jgi:hypothetical protein
MPADHFGHTLPKVTASQEERRSFSGCVSQLLQDRPHHGDHINASDPIVCKPTDTEIEGKSLRITFRADEALGD